MCDANAELLQAIIWYKNKHAPRAKTAAGHAY